jgi:transmembrane sensor
VALRFKIASPQSTATEQAIGWYARQRSKPLSEEDAARFAAWLKDDAAHVAAWKEVERLWERVGAVRDDPAILALREAARQRLESRRSSPRKWSVAAGLVAGIILSVGAWWSIKGSIFTGANRAGLSLVREASTEVGERFTLVLPDGSKVTLNTASAVRAEYSEHQRRVTLIRGEAFFNVAKDAARPFIVSAGSREVQAVGTAFDVRLQSRELRIALVEGQVRVLPSASPAAANSTETPGPVTLVAGTALVVSNDGAQRIETEDALHATSWLSGKLIFEDERLADVVAEMNQYSQEKLQIANSSLGERKVSGVFEATDGASLAKALQDYGIAQVTEHSATAIVLDLPSGTDNRHQSLSP